MIVLYLQLHHRLCQLTILPLHGLADLVVLLLNDRERIAVHIYLIWHILLLNLLDFIESSECLLIAHL